MNPNISIIIPIYNTEKYLARCLDSLCAQTLHPIEIICVNDGSSDKSSAILHSYAENDSRFVIVEFSRNKGAAAARNAGMGLAGGDYLGFVDSDDTVDSFFYERLYTKALDTDSDIVKGVRRQVFPEGTVKDELSNTLICKDRFAFFTQWTSAIYRREFVRDNGIECPPGISNAEDTVFLMKAVSLCKKIVVVNDACYHYLRRNNSLNSKYLSLKKIEATCRAMREIVRFANLKIADAPAYGKLFLFSFNNCMGVCKRALPEQAGMAANICAEHLIALYGLCHKPSLLDDLLQLSGVDFENALKCGDTKSLAGVLLQTPKTRLFSQLRARICHA